MVAIVINNIAIFCPSVFYKNVYIDIRLHLCIPVHMLVPLMAGRIPTHKAPAETYV